jgi:hypothetical protein
MTHRPSHMLAEMREHPGGSVGRVAMFAAVPTREFAFSGY